MIMNADYDNQALPPAEPAEASGKPKQSSSDQQPLGLIQEIIALVESGENPARLRDLLGERHQQIEAQLALGPQPDLVRLLEWRATQLDVMQPFQQAIHRTDLTMPELLFLHEIAERTRDQLLKSLTVEKELVEWMRRPGKRRYARLS